MATSFAATKINGPSYLGTEMKAATYSLQLPSSWLAAGITWDLTADDDFDYVTAIVAHVTGDAADWDLADSINMEGGTITAGKGYPAATVKLVAHNGGTVVADATDLSDFADLTVVVFGS